MANLRFSIDDMQIDIRRHNAGLREEALSRIQKRKERIAKEEAFRERIKARGITLRRYGDDGAQKVLMPVIRKRLAFPEVRVPPAGPPRTVLLDQSYEDILQAIRSMAVVFERNHQTFADFKEPDLRNVLLVGLNATFQGKATGETFNGIGDCDIIIRENDQNIFIGECLIWDGPKHLLEKMDSQLFKYATWRDEKLALIVFSRHRGFTAMRDSMKQTVADHPLKPVLLNYPHQNCFQFRFRREDDAQREFILTCLAFDIIARTGPSGEQIVG